MRKIKLLEVAKSFYPSLGGLENFIYNRIRIYEDLGIDYKILTTDYQSGKESNEINFPAHRIIRLKYFTPYIITPALRSELLNNYDIISINQIGKYICDYSQFISRRKKKKIILTPHFKFHTSKYSIVKNTYNKFVAPSVLNIPDVIICFTEYEKKYWIDQFKIESERILVIPHYYNSFPNSSYTQSTQNENMILYLGRLDSNKRIDLLLRAFNSLSNGLSLALTINYNDLTKELKKITDENNKILLLGDLNEKEKSEMLNRAAALILPSECEAFGIVLFEASFFKKPILCSKIPVFQEILDKNGVMYFENNIISIREVLNKFNDLGAEEKKKMGDINFNNLANYQYNSIKEKYSYLFDNLLKD